MTALSDVQAAIAQIGTHVTAAGAALTNPITDVARAHPVPTSARCIRWWYDGEADPAKLGAKRTLTDEMQGFSVQIVAFWSMATQGTILAADVDDEALALTIQINQRIIGDGQLNAHCTDLSILAANTGFIGIGGGSWRTLEIEVIPQFVDLYPIAP